MMNRRSASILAVTGVALLALLAGCQAVFTYSPLSFLQRDPANLPPEQQVSWAEQALASGDPQAMAQAYELVKDDPDQAYLAASLAAELSGVTQALADAIADLDTIRTYDSTQLEAFLDDFFSSVTDSYASAAGTHFQDVMSGAPSQLSGQDMILGALCLAFAAVSPTDNFGGATSLEADAIDDYFITPGLNVLLNVLLLPADDPAVEILTQLQTFINSTDFHTP
jgi:hypothetical protein